MGGGDISVYCSSLEKFVRVGACECARGSVRSCVCGTPGWCVCVLVSVGHAWECQCIMGFKAIISCSRSWKEAFNVYPLDSY